MFQFQFKDGEENVVLDFYNYSKASEMHQFDEAFAYVHTGEYGDAVKTMLEANVRYHKCIESAYLLCICCIERGEMEEALYWYDMVKHEKDALNKSGLRMPRRSGDHLYR